VRPANKDNQIQFRVDDATFARLQTLGFRSPNLAARFIVERSLPEPSTRGSRTNSAETELIALDLAAEAVRSRIADLRAALLSRSSPARQSSASPERADTATAPATGAGDQPRYAQGR
jgi:hypothetical protein